MGPKISRKAHALGTHGPARAALAAAVALVACAPEEPAFAPPGAILGRPLPNEGTAAGPSVFGAPFDQTANVPSTTMVKAHATVAGPREPSDTLDCLSCHSSDGAAKNKAFSFGGRVMKGKAPAPNVDVIVVDGADKLGPVKSDADGFFWLVGAPVKAGSKTHVRSAAGTESMSSPLGEGKAASCDSASCHVPGKQEKINVP